MKVIDILKEHFADVMTPEVEKNITTSIELMISEKVSEKEESLKEKIQEDLQKEFDKKYNDLVEKIDTYIEKVNDEIIDENLKNVEMKTKVELAEKLYTSVINVIKENDMNIAVESKNIIKQQEEEIAKLEESLNDSLKKIEESKKEKFEFEKAIAFKTLTENLTDTDEEKVCKMVENISVADIDDFKEKVNVAIGMITEKKDLKSEDDDVLDENFDNLDSKETDEFFPSWMTSVK